MKFYESELKLHVTTFFTAIVSHEKKDFKRVLKNVFMRVPKIVEFEHIICLIANLAK